MRLRVSSYYALLATLAWVPIAADTPGEIQVAIERKAQTHLIDLARTAGLRKPSVQVTVLARETVIPCNLIAKIEAIDASSVTRMRYSAACTDPAWEREFIVRSVITADVVTARENVRAGNVIDAAMLALERRELTSMGDAVSDPALIADKSTRRALRAGQVVNPRWLVEPVLVQRGASVTILARNVGVEVRVAGEALATGRRGELVQVRNKANGSVIRARVIGENTVEPVTSTSPASP